MKTIAWQLGSSFCCMTSNQARNRIRTTLGNSAMPWSDLLIWNTFILAFDVYICAYASLLFTHAAVPTGSFAAIANQPIYRMPVPRAYRPLPRLRDAYHLLYGLLGDLGRGSTDIYRYDTVFALGFL
jgi:hypothetical protein